MTDTRLGLLSRRQFLEILAATGVVLPMAGALDRLLPIAEAATTAAKKNVADVLRFSTRPQGWKGLFGFVTLRLHPVFFNGQRAYHIRTDVSDADFAKRVGLVHVIRLAGALKNGDTADYYLFTNRASGQLPVVSTAPGRDDFTPAFRLSRVTFTRTPQVLNSVDAIRDAQAGGMVRIGATSIVVNYPFVKWPDGELSRDTKREVYLGDGQLLNPPNVEKREVTFKLHQCFPGEWYIVTDTSAAPMAPMMKIIASPRTSGLTKAGATAKILVFGNGIKGSGPMGFQPSVVDSLPGHPLWSPFWDHYTFTWVEGRTPSVVRNQEELVALEKAGALKRWPGTPDTQGQTFVVNCPVPVTAPMTWKP
ncbi:MAG: hypothetical protein HY355_03910 [Armatimonadetes bacterium]|nr:hypothetical protein [Armatimonadota bacterium]